MASKEGIEQQIANEALKLARRLHGASDTATATVTPAGSGQIPHSSGEGHTTGRLYDVRITDGEGIYVMQLLDEYFPGRIRVNRIHLYSTEGPECS